MEQEILPAPAPVPVPVKTQVISVTGKTMPEGLDERGKFKAGNELTPKEHKGDPYAAELQKFRHCVLSSVKLSELRAIVKAMIQKACDGDVNAAKLIMERVCGRNFPQDAGIQINNLSQGDVTIRIQMENEEQEQQDKVISMQDTQEAGPQLPPIRQEPPCAL